MHQRLRKECQFASVEYRLHTKQIDKHLIRLLYCVKNVPLVKLLFNIAYVREVFK